MTSQYRICPMQLFMENYFFLTEVVVELTPTIVHQYEPSSVDPPTKKSCKYSAALKKWLLQFDSAKQLDTIVGCSFNYRVLEEQFNCNYVSIICKFTKESDLVKFEELFENGCLEKLLEQYFTKPDLLLEFGVGTRTTNKEFRLEVDLTEKKQCISESYRAR